MAWRMAGVSAALDTYASSPHSILGATQYFGGFLADQATSLAAKLNVLRALPGATALGNLAADVAGQAVDSALPSPQSMHITMSQHKITKNYPLGAMFLVGQLAAMCGAIVGLLGILLLGNLLVGYFLPRSLL